jgi:hypothetical protein
VANLLRENRACGRGAFSNSYLAVKFLNRFFGFCSGSLSLVPDTCVSWYSQKPSAAACMTASTTNTEPVNESFVLSREFGMAVVSQDRSIPPWQHVLRDKSTLKRKQWSCTNVLSTADALSNITVQELCIRLSHTEAVHP